MLLASVALASVRWVDVARYPVPVVQALFPVFGAGILLVTALAALARYRRVAAAGILPSVAVVVLAVASLLPHTVAPSGSDLVVMSANLQYGRGSADDVMQAVREHDVDVLVLIEITPEADERLRDAALDTLLPHAVGHSASGAGGSVIRSRYPMTQIDAGDAQLRIRRFDEPVARVATPSGPLVVRAAHPYPPIRGMVADWREGLSLIDQWAREQPADSPLVIAGDFNASRAHPGFRQLLGTLTDSHRAAGQGWVRTWPQGGRIPRFVQIDHVLVRGLGVVDAGVVPLASSDHAAVWARVSPGG